jgi:hypothetical protein
LLFWKTRLAAALTVAVTVVACSLDDIVPDGSLPIDDGASAGAKDSLKVDGSNEARLELKTGASLTVPKDALDHEVDIGIERPADSKAVEFVESLKSVKAVASAPYVLTPHGTEFMKELKLEIPVVANKGKELVAVYLKDESDREWKYLDTPTVENDVATVTIKHFSVIVLVDRERAGVAEDAGSAPPAETDAGHDDVDAGAPVVDDAGDTPRGEDAGSSAALDAGSAPIDSPVPDASANTVKDAGTQTMRDAAQAQLDASASADAGSGADDASAALPDAGTMLDAGPPVDAGQAPDAGTGADDASAQLPPDTGAPVDSATQDAASCQPTFYCEPGLCGWYADGCGGEIPCGACDQACDLYDAGLCPIG